MLQQQEFKVEVYLKSMNNLYFICILVIVIVLGIILVTDNEKKVIVKEQCITDTIYIKDSVDIKQYELNIINYNTIIKSLKDSIVILNEDLIVTKYKLGRIEEYNKIAGRGNNIKYLRGWINRVLND